MGLLKLETLPSADVGQKWKHNMHMFLQAGIHNPALLQEAYSSTFLEVRDQIQEHVVRSIRNNLPRVMNIHAFGSWMSTPKRLFPQAFEGLTEVFDPGLNGKLAVLGSPWPPCSEGSCRASCAACHGRGAHYQHIHHVGAWARSDRWATAPALL